MLTIFIKAYFDNAIVNIFTLFNFEALRCDTYWRAARKRGRRSK